MAGKKERERNENSTHNVVAREETRRYMLNSLLR